MLGRESVWEFRSGFSTPILFSAGTLPNIWIRDYKRVSNATYDNITPKVALGASEMETFFTCILQVLLIPAKVSLLLLTTLSEFTVLFPL